MFKNHLRILLITTFFALFLLSDLQIVSPHDHSSPIYFVTSVINKDRYQSEIWQYQMDSPEAKRILVLKPNRQTKGQSFSANELSHLRDYVKQSGNLEKGWAEDNPAIDYTRAVWRFDDTHLLIQTDYEVQDGWARMGDSWTRGRFGYYEYSLVELADTPKVTSFFKVDYHDAAYKDWPLVATNPFVYPESLWLNPTQSKIAFVLTPESVFCPSLLCSSILILDYSHTPAQTTMVPLATDPIWSPDGERLAYLQTQCDQPIKNCLTHIEIMSMKDGSLEQIPNWDYDKPFVETVTSRQFPFGWLDNHTLFYRKPWAKFVLDNPIYSHEIFDLATHSMTDFPADKIDDYAVSAERAGLYYGFKAETGFFDNQIPIILENGQRKFLSGLYPTYNSRFPDRMIFRESNANQIVVFESGNKQSLIDLSAILPKDEWVAAIAP